MAYQIVEAFPRHCSITDGIIGTGYNRLPMTYLNERYAHALAGRMHQQNYDHCGDSSFFVIEAGQPVLNRLGRENRAPNMWAGGAFPIDCDDDCPF